jgi:hypothetical protein
MIPMLPHPTSVTIEPLDESVLIKDADAREVKRGERGGTPFTIDAQIKWNDFATPLVLAQGVREEFDGWILVRCCDMDDLGITIKRRDRITAMGTLTDLSLYILGSQPLGHYPDQGGHTLLRYYFSTRKPSRE